MPEITVLMPVRNGEQYIKEAIDSVLNQTLTDFEFLIIDDGSTDRTVEIIQGYTDKRIRLVRKEHQFIQNLNEGLELASGSYIARMDAAYRTIKNSIKTYEKKSGYYSLWNMG